MSPLFLLLNALGLRDTLAALVLTQAPSRCRSRCGVYAFDRATGARLRQHAGGWPA